jgi:hypothetical protein
MTSYSSAYMTDDVPKVLAAMDMAGMPQEMFDQVSELRVECWTRITRIKLQINDIYGCQLAAEQCLQGKLFSDFYFLITEF